MYEVLRGCLCTLDSIIMKHLNAGFVCVRNFSPLCTHVFYFFSNSVQHKHQISSNSRYSNCSRVCRCDRPRKDGTIKGSCNRNGAAAAAARCEIRRDVCRRSWIYYVSGPYEPRKFWFSRNPFLLCYVVIITAIMYSLKCAVRSKTL